MEDKKSKALILIDEANLYYGFRHRNWELDYKNFYQWLHDNFEPIAIYLFSGIVSKKMFLDKNPRCGISEFIQAKGDKDNFIKYLKSLGYLVKTKPVSSVFDSTSSKFKRKCNFDVEITIIAIDCLSQYEELVLCSGDGDFVKLLKYVKGKFKKTTIIAHKDRLNQQLEITANRTIYLESLKSILEKKRGLP